MFDLDCTFLVKIELRKSLEIRISKRRWKKLVGEFKYYVCELIADMNIASLEKKIEKKLTTLAPGANFQKWRLDKARQLELIIVFCINETEEGEFIVEELIEKLIMRNIYKDTDKYSFFDSLNLIFTD